MLGERESGPAPPSSSSSSGSPASSGPLTCPRAWASCCRAAARRRWAGRSRQRAGGAAAREERGRQSSLHVVLPPTVCSTESQQPLSAPPKQQQQRTEKYSISPMRMGELPLRPDTLVQKSESEAPPLEPPPPRDAAAKDARWLAPTAAAGSVQGFSAALRGHGAEDRLRVWPGCSSRMRAVKTGGGLPRPGACTGEPAVALPNLQGIFPGGASGQGCGGPRQEGAALAPHSPLGPEQPTGRPLQPPHCGPSITSSSAGRGAARERAVPELASSEPAAARGHTGSDGRGRQHRFCRQQTERACGNIRSPVARRSQRRQPFVASRPSLLGVVCRSRTRACKVAHRPCTRQGSAEAGPARASLSTRRCASVKAGTAPSSSERRRDMRRHTRPPRPHFSACSHQPPHQLLLHRSVHQRAPGVSGLARERPATLCGQVRSRGLPDRWPQHP